MVPEAAAASANGNPGMGKAAVPSLAASVLLHLALPFGIGVQVLNVRRAPLLPSQPTELELVPMDPAPAREVSLAALATGSRMLPLVERAPQRRSAAPSVAVSPAPPLPAPPLPTAASPVPASPVPASESRGVALPGAESELAPESTPSAVVAAPASSAAPSSVAAPASLAAPDSTPPSSGAGAVLAASGAVGRGATGSTAGAIPGLGGSATGSGDAERALRAAYLQELRRRVLGHRVYPYQARRARLEGSVCLRVSLNGQGEVARLQATCDAPEPLLEAAFAAVRAAAPFGPLPSGRRELTLDLPMVFQLEAL